MKWRGTSSNGQNFLYSQDFPSGDEKWHTRHRLPYFMPLFGFSANSLTVFLTTGKCVWHFSASLKERKGYAASSHSNSYAKGSTSAYWSTSGMSAILRHTLPASGTYTSKRRYIPNHSVFSGTPAKSLRSTRRRSATKKRDVARTAQS